MATYSVILEDAQTSTAGGLNKITFDNQRIKTIEATDLDDAWLLARTKYYIEQIDGPNTQIKDIQAGVVTLEKEPQSEGLKEEE